MGDNVLGSVRPSIHPSVRLCSKMNKTDLTYYVAHVHHTSVTFTERSKSEAYISHDSSEADGHRHHRCITCIQHTGYWVLRGGGGLGGGWTNRGMLIRHGPPSDFGPYHAIAVVWEAGQGNDDLTLDTRRFAAAPLSPVGPAEVAWASGYTGCSKVFGPDPSGPSASGFGGFTH